MENLLKMLKNKRKKIFFLLGGNWFFYHKIAQILQTYGYDTYSICYDNIVYKHTIRYNRKYKVYFGMYLLDNVFNIDFKIENILINKVFSLLTLNEIIQTDRFFYNKKYFNGLPIEDYFIGVAKYIYEIFKKEQPVAIVFEPSSAYSLIAEQVARFLGIKTIYPQWPKTKYGFEIAESFEGFFSIHEREFKRLKNINLTNEEIKKANKFMEQFISKTLKPNFCAIDRDTFWEKFESKVNALFLLLTNLKDDRIRYIFIQTLKKYTFDKIVSRYNKKFFRKDISTDERFFFYPLHYDPDLASLLWSRTLHNQLEIVRMISAALPVGYKLYVKEHPAQKYNRNINFYKILESFHNVKLIKAEVDSHELIKNSIATITLAGTAGFESILYGKKPIVLGDNFYKDNELVLYVQNFRNLKHIIKSALHKENLNIEKDIVLKFALSYINTVTPIKKIYTGYSYKFVPLEEVKAFAEKIDSIIKGSNANF